MATRMPTLFSRWAVRVAPAVAAVAFVASPWPTAASDPSATPPSGRMMAAGASTLSTASTTTCGSRGASTTCTATSAKSFTMSGSSTTPIGPGRSGTLVVTVQNPNHQALQVTSISATVGTPTGGLSAPGLQACSSAWVSVTGYRFVTGATALVAPAGGTVTVPLVVTFTDLPATNQDSCKGATFPVSLSGTGQQA